MKVSEVVGQRVREARLSRRQSMREVSEVLNERFGTKWTVVTMSEAELGRRSFIAEEVSMFAAFYGRDPGWFFCPPVPGTQVEIAGVPIPRGPGAVAVSPSAHALFEFRRAALLVEDVLKADLRR